MLNILGNKMTTFEICDTTLGTQSTSGIGYVKMPA